MADVFIYDLPEMAVEPDDSDYIIVSDTSDANATKKFSYSRIKKDPVTITGEDYLTLSSQEITANKINLETNVTGTLPITSGGTGQSTDQGYLTSSGGWTAAGTCSFSGNIDTVSLTINGYDAFTDVATGAANNKKIAAQGYVDDAIINTEITQATTDILTEAECRGTIINNYGQSVANTQTLPTASQGLNFIFVVSTSGADAVHLKAGPSDKIYLDGVALDDGDKITCATPVVGNSISFFTMKIGVSSWDWIAETIRGTWIDGGV